MIADAIRHVGAGGVVCLTGIGSGGRTTGLYPAILLARLVFLATGGGLAGPGQGAPLSGPGQGEKSRPAGSREACPLHRY